MKRALLVAIACGLMAVPVASGHMLPHSKSPAKMTPKQEYRYGVGTARHATRAIAHYKLVIAWFKARPASTIHHTNAYRAFVAQSAFDRAQRMVRDHRWLLKEGERLRQDGWKRLHPLPAIPHKDGWDCIHGFEGSWKDSGDPYWGGLQMDRNFMETYGSDYIRRFHGYANVWPIWAQMAAAERAYYSSDGHGGIRGYHPWPNTARSCGLL